MDARNEPQEKVVSVTRKVKYMNLTYSCVKCGDQVSLPESLATKAEKIKVVCEECVDHMEGERAGEYFIPEVDDEDEEDEDIHDNDSA